MKLSHKQRLATPSASIYASDTVSMVSRLATIAVLACGTALQPVQADLILDIDDSSVHTSNGTDFKVDVRVIANDNNDADLTFKTQVSAVNFLLTFSTPQTDVDFTGVSAPVSDALFANASYSSGGGNPNAYMFGSVFSNAPASDPLLDNKTLLTLMYSVPNGFAGTVDIAIQSSDTINSSGDATFFVTSGSEENVPFDSLSGGTFASSAIPEPGSFVLLASACLAMCLRVYLSGTRALQDLN